jgi:hypothetical protein
MGPCWILVHSKAGGATLPSKMHSSTRARADASTSGRIVNKFRLTYSRYHRAKAAHRQVRRLRSFAVAENVPPLNSRQLAEDADQMEAIALGFTSRLQELHDKAPGDQELPDVDVAATAWNDADLQAEGEALQLSSETARKVLVHVRCIMRSAHGCFLPCS